MVHRCRNSVNQFLWCVELSPGWWKCITVWLKRRNDKINCKIPISKLKWKRIKFGVENEYQAENMVVMPAMRLVRCPGWCAAVQRRASVVAQGSLDTLFVTTALFWRSSWKESTTPDDSMLSDKFFRYSSSSSTSDGNSKLIFSIQYSTVASKVAWRNSTLSIEHLIRLHKDVVVEHRST